MIFIKNYAIGTPLIVLIFIICIIISFSLSYRASSKTEERIAFVTMMIVVMALASGLNVINYYVDYSVKKMEKRMQYLKLSKAEDNFDFKVMKYMDMEENQSRHLTKKEVYRLLEKIRKDLVLEEIREEIRKKRND